MSRTDAKWAIGDPIDGWFEPYRRRSTNGDVSPIEFERGHRQEARAAA